MFLSRIALNPDERNTMFALHSSNIFHGALESCFPGERKRRLWRLDRLNGALYILILSDEDPNLSPFCKQFGLAENAWETKDYDLLLKRLATGTLWRFRLTANSRKRGISNQDGVTGKIYAHVTTKHQKEWLLERAEKHGFQISEDSFDVVESQWKQFHKKAEHKITIFSVTYEGILKITDVDLFRKALTEGIGHAKAYGMGLLTVTRL